MAPLRTAVTTAALRRGTHRFASGDGKSKAVGLVRRNVSPAVKSSMVVLVHVRELPKDSRDIPQDSNEDAHRCGDVDRISVCAGSHFNESRDPSRLPTSTFYPSLSQSLVDENVSKKFEHR